MLRPLGIRLPMQAGKGYHLHLPAEALRLRHSLILVEGRVAGDADGRVRCASPARWEIAGTKLRRCAPSRVRGIVRTAAAVPPRRARLGARPDEGVGRPPPVLARRPALRRRLRARPERARRDGPRDDGVSASVPVTGEAIAALLSGEAPPVVARRRCRPTALRDLDGGASHVWCLDASPTGRERVGFRLPRAAEQLD